jgi:hypothetical protein
MPGGARLDLFFERASAVGAAARPAIRMIVDKAGVEGALKLGWQAPTPVVARIITTIIRMTRQGATWPLRALGRGQWSTLAMIELDLINAQLAQLMAVRRDPANFYKNTYALARALSQAERDELDNLTAEALTALQTSDSAALKAVHLRVMDAMAREGRAACVGLGVDYPIGDEGEREIRRLLDAAWPD